MTPQIWIIALTLYGEAGGEGKEGIDLVAQVISNRAERKGKSADSICLEPKQFSFWNGKKELNITIEDFCQTPDYQSESFFYCIQVAKNLPRPDKYGYYYYHTFKCKPVWSKQARVDKNYFRWKNHLFFTKQAIDGKG